jgi:hypothetical protein
MASYRFSKCIYPTLVISLGLICGARSAVPLGASPTTESAMSVSASLGQSSPAQEADSNGPSLSAWELSLFASFQEELGFEDMDLQAATKTGKAPNPQPDYEKILGLHDDEYQEMRSTLLDAFYRLRDLSHEMEEVNNAMHKQDSPELEARSKELGAENPKIEKEAILRVKRQLGPEAYHKVFAYLCSRDMGCPAATKSSSTAN